MISGPLRPGPAATGQRPPSIGAVGERRHRARVLRLPGIERSTRVAVLLRMPVVAAGPDALAVPGLPAQSAPVDQPVFRASTWVMQRSNCSTAGDRPPARVVAWICRASPLGRRTGR